MASLPSVGKFSQSSKKHKQKKKCLHKAIYKAPGLATVPS